jgi:hypothetical protein
LEGSKAGSRRNGDSGAQKARRLLKDWLPKTLVEIESRAPFVRHSLETDDLEAAIAARHPRKSR